MVKCKDCGNEISARAAACPKCGAPGPRAPTGSGVGCGTVVVIGVLLAIVAWILKPASKTPPPASTVAQGWTHVRTIGHIRMAVIAAGRLQEEGLYEAAANSLCPRGRAEICSVIFWADAKDVPMAMPMTDDEVRMQVANFRSNGHTGLRKMLYACEIVPDPDRCFSDD